MQPEVGGKKVVKKKIKIKGLGDDMENQPKREVAEGWVVSPRVVAALVSRVASDGRAGLWVLLWWDVGWWKRRGWSGGAIVAAASTPLKHKAAKGGVMGSHWCW